jgi:UDP-2,3-diacylglucosamine pyrophosphatase LpxH
MPDSQQAPLVHILSDLHLMRPQDTFYQSVLRFLSEVPRSGDHLALAGDIFDVYVGNKSVFRELHRPFFERIREAGQRGITVHHIEGNHDFWIAESYSEMGCTTASVHGDFVEIHLAGRTLRIEHGDLADSSDWFYLALRRFFRSNLGSVCARLAPEKALDRLGQLWSNTSRDAKRLPEEWDDHDRERLREVFYQYSRTRVGPGKADALVMGHCHDPHGCEGYMNVGFPRRHKSWIRWNPAENRLERLLYDFQS